MKIIYIAGAYTGNKYTTELENVHEAIGYGNEVIKLGHAPFVPHLSHYQNELFPHDYEKWMSIDFKMLEKCDAVWRIPGASKGADREVQHAKSKNIPVFYTLEEVERFLKQYTTFYEDCPTCINQHSFGHEGTIGVGHHECEECGDTGMRQVRSK